MELDVTSLLFAPLCACNIISTKNTVQKDGKNKGREYYKCEQSKCSFFEWKDQALVNSDHIKLETEHKKPSNRKVLNQEFQDNVDIHWILPMYSKKVIDQIKVIFEIQNIPFVETNVLEKIRLGYDFILNQSSTVHVVSASEHWRNYNYFKFNVTVPSDIRSKIDLVYNEKYKNRSIIPKPINEDGFWVLKNDCGDHIKSPLERKQIDYILFYKNEHTFFICHRQSVVDALNIEDMMQNDTCIYITKQMVQSMHVYSLLSNKI